VNAEAQATLRSLVAGSLELVKLELDADSLQKRHDGVALAEVGGRAAPRSRITTAGRRRRSAALRSSGRAGAGSASCALA